MVAWSCWHHTHTTVPDRVLTKQSNTHMQSRRLRHHVHFAYADCSIVGDPTPKPSLTRTHSLSTTTHTAQPYYSLPYLSHQHQHSHKHKQTKQWTPTTLTLSWQVNDALRKKKKKPAINCLFLTSSLNQTYRPSTPPLKLSSRTSKS